MKKWFKEKWNSLKEIWNIVSLFRKSHSKDKFLEIAELIQDKKKIIMLAAPEQQAPYTILYYTTDDELDIEYAAQCKDMIKNSIVNVIGPQRYEMSLDRFDPDMALAYKEADYQMTRAEYLDAELQYVKTINDPNGFGANQTKHMWDRVCELKSRLEAFEEELKQQ